MTSQTRKVTIKQGKLTESFQVRELDDWQAVAAALVRTMAPGSIVSLSGPLGAGKTTLVQYVARLLGAPKRALSPTFALMRIYKIEARRLKLESWRGQIQLPASRFELRRLVHVDAYRLEDEKDLVVLALDEELMEPGTAVLIEWPENIKNWLSKKHPIKVLISY
jgi:tRNA threonylcarbamoyladenosine biosynthesis protein TsaE